MAGSLDLFSPPFPRESRIGQNVPPPPLPHQHDCHSKSHTFEIPPDHTSGQNRLAEQTGTHTHLHYHSIRSKGKVKASPEITSRFIGTFSLFMLDLANSTDNTCDDPFRICTMIENCSISHVLLESL